MTWKDNLSGILDSSMNFSLLFIMSSTSFFANIPIANYVDEKTPFCTVQKTTNISSALNVATPILLHKK